MGSWKDFSSTRWNERTVKALTGGDTITARFMRQDFFSFVPTHKLIVGANHRPRVRGQEEAMWRRIRLVPFEVTIPADERDPDLGRKLRAESAGILAWAVRGCVDWQRERLGVPAAVKAATSEYRDEQDHLGPFLEDACELAPGVFTATAALFAAYTSWCSRTGAQAWQRENFREGLLERDHALRARKGAKGARGIEGLRLRTKTPTVSIDDLTRGGR
ncbi:MAG: hypothetical protein H0T46_06510 [Deltaproteobacteria bacterium]|nr:hypothetical protein [Deltaproteobacteria bacterium]